MKLFSNSLIIVVTLFFTSILLYGEEEQYFKDVPKNHWAYEAVQELAERGIIEGFEGKASRKFKGDKSLTRYEFAQALLKCIRKLEAEIGVSRPNGTIDEALINDALNKSNLNKDEVVLLKKLINEFKKELADMNLRVSDLERKQREEELRSQDNTALYLSIGASIISIVALLAAVL